jgi:hypothetical protein
MGCPCGVEEPACNITAPIIAVGDPDCEDRRRRPLAAIDEHELARKIREAAERVPSY